MKTEAKGVAFSETCAILPSNKGHASPGSVAKPVCVCVKSEMKNTINEKMSTKFMQCSSQLIIFTPTNKQSGKYK